MFAFGMIADVYPNKGKDCVFDYLSKYIQGDILNFRFQLICASQMFAPVP